MSYDVNIDSKHDVPVLQASTEPADADRDRVVDMSPSLIEAIRSIIFQASPA
jgi:hypothetical protein